MTTEWQLFEITQRGRNFPVSGNGVERGTAVRARYSRKLGDFIIYYCLGQPPAEWIGGVHHPPVPLSTFAAAHSDSGTGYSEVSLRLMRLIATCLLSMLSTLHSPLSTLYSPLCTLHSALSTLHSPLCALHSALSTLHSVLCTLHSAHCTLSFVLRPLSSILSPLPSPLSPLYSSLDLHNWKKIATFARFFIL